MNGKPLIVDIAGKALETDKNRKKREKECFEEIAAILKKYDCKFVVAADPKVHVQAITRNQNPS